MADAAVDIIGFQGTQHPTKEISLNLEFCQPAWVNMTSYGIPPS